MGAILPQIPARMGTIAVPILILACITLPALVAASSKIANGPLKKPATSGLVMTAAGMAILVQTGLLVAAPAQDRVSLSREGSRRRRRRWRELLDSRCKRLWFTKKPFVKIDNFHLYFPKF